MDISRHNNWSNNSQFSGLEFAQYLSLPLSIVSVITIQGLSCFLNLPRRDIMEISSSCIFDLAELGTETYDSFVRNVQVR